ncbi:MAG: hypothetical protein KC493_17410 [Bacteriovoracaceae bacterium]|nr:hypothetical protein [Bacteriovoracaceae bacterium]
MENYQRWLKPSWQLAIFFIFCSYMIYGHTLHFPFFTFDDGLHILGNQEVLNFSFKNLLHFWTDSKIPIPYNIWQFTNLIAGENPAAFRIVNIVFHGGSSYLIFLVLNEFIEITKRNDYSWITLSSSLFFLVHPLNVESVVWISSLKGILSLFFALLSFFYYLKITNVNSKNNNKVIVLSIVFYAFSLLSKPVSVVMPVIFIICDHFLLKRDVKSKLWLYFYYISFTISLSLLHIKGIDAEDLSLIPFLDRLYIAGSAIPFYLLKVIAPFDIYVIYPDSIFRLLLSATERDKLMIAVFNFSLLCFLVALWTKKDYRKHAASLFFFLLLIMPISGIIPFEFQRMSFVSDRYSYHPLLGISFFLAFTLITILQKKPQFTKGLKYVTLFIIAVFSIKNFQQSAKWSSNSTILKESYKKGPGNDYLGVSYAQSRSAEYDFDESMKILSSIYEKDPKFTEALSSIVDTYSFRCDHTRATRILELLDSVDTPLPLDTLMKKAILHIGVDQLKEASRILTYIETSNFGMSEQAKNLFSSIRFNLKKTEEHSYKNLGFLFYERGELKKALNFFRIAHDISDTPESYVEWISEVEEKILERRE